MRSRLQVLHLMPFSPVPPDFGGALRVFHVLRQLSARYDVTVLGYGEPSQANAVREALPNVKDVRFLRPTWKARHRRLGQLYSTFTRHSFFQLSVVGAALQREIDRLTRATTFDVIQTEFSHLGPLRLPAGPLKVLDTHNVEYDNFRRMWETTRQPVRKLHYLLEYRKQRHDELAWCRMQDALFATSERDAELFGADVPEVPRFVVPNGVDTAFFSAGEPPGPGELEPTSLVFTGMMAYVPNYDGVGWFLDEVFPRVLSQVPTAKLYVVGKSPLPQLTRRASDRVVITGTVPDVRPYVRRAAVYVVPLRMGGGTRLKIAEALSMKKPMVTTSIGCEGIALRDGEHALIADAPQAFADAVVRLLRDAELRARLTEAGHALVKRLYDWDVIGAQLERIYDDLLARRAGSRG